MNTKLDYLYRVEPPWIYVGPGESERKKWIPSYFYSPFKHTKNTSLNEKHESQAMLKISCRAVYVAQCKRWFASDYLAADRMVNSV
jgi:hypothetical protein